jgi:hypothetical protein
MPNMPAIQQFQQPDIVNSAAKAMQIRAYRDQIQNVARTQQNKQAQDQIKFQAEQKAIQRKNSIDANDFALNLLTGVNSDEDLKIAKGQFNARYPQQAGAVGRILPSYNPEAINVIRNSLRTETQRLKKEEKDEELKGFGAGTMMFRGGKQAGQVPFAPTKDQFEVFQSSEGDQVYVKKGDKIPEGYSKVMAKGTQVTIQTGNLGKTTKTGLEQDIIMGIQNIQSFQETRKLFKPEYLTMFGRGQKLIAEVADKAGIPTKGQKKLIRKRSKWFRQAKADFIAYRKWATGVAGGEKELKEIATSFPDPVKNSPTQYTSHLDGIEETTKRILATNVEFLRSGIDLKQPLEKVLEQAKKIGIPSPPGTSTSPTIGRTEGIVIRFNEKGERIP